MNLTRALSLVFAMICALTLTSCLACTTCGDKKKRQQEAAVAAGACCAHAGTEECCSEL